MRTKKLTHCTNSRQLRDYETRAAMAVNLPSSSRCGSSIKRLCEAADASSFLPFASGAGGLLYLHRRGDEGADESGEEVDKMNS